MTSSAPISMSSALLPALSGMLRNLDHLLDKALASAEQRHFKPEVLMQTRLAPDMLPFASQVRIACDTAKYGAARLAGVEAPRHDDNEATLAELKSRIRATLDFLATVQAEQIDGSEAREISFPVGRERTIRTMAGEAYLKHWVLPNFYFHVVTAYALLRHNGVDVGKVDYLAGSAGAAGA